MSLSRKVHEVRCFAQRMLNAFRGVMHCVVSPWADAVTKDGRSWTLYVRKECLYGDNDSTVSRARYQVRYLIVARRFSVRTDTPSGLRRTGAP